MATYLRDVGSNAVLVEGCSISTTSTTVTGSSQNMLSPAGDGRCNCIVDVSALSSAATLNIFVEGSTNGTAGWTLITSATITTTGVTAFSFDRTTQYVRSYNSITSNKTASYATIIVEQLKTF